MSTVTASKSVVSCWSDVLTSGQISQSQSLMFVKKLTALAISNILYLRAVFPEAAFGDRTYDDMTLKLLKENSKCPSASTCIRWIRGSFEALDKKYLRQMIIGVFQKPNNAQVLLESYTFQFGYNRNAASVSLYRNETQVGQVAVTKKATTMLLRTLVVVMQNLKPLPDNICMTMKLQYYDEVTPEDYEPPGFKSCETLFDYDIEVMTVKIGNVNTPFHDMKLRVKSDKSQFEIKEGKCAAAPQLVPIAAKNMERKNDKFGKQNERDLLVSKLNACDLNSPQIQSSAKCAAVDDMVMAKGNGPKPNGNVSGLQVLDDNRCPCGVHEDDGLMILCAICDKWQHAICFRVQSADDAPEKHICELCAQVEVPGREPTDRELVGLASDAIQRLCLYRRTLHALLDLNFITPNELAVRLGVTMNIACEIMNRLQSEGFVKKMRGAQRVVKRDNIRRVGFPQYIYNIAVNEPEIGSFQQTCASTASELTQRSIKRTNGCDLNLSPLGHDFNFDPSQDTEDLPTDAKRRKTSEVAKHLANI